MGTLTRKDPCPNKTCSPKPLNQSQRSSRGLFRGRGKSHVGMPVALRGRKMGLSGELRFSTEQGLLHRDRSPWAPQTRSHPAAQPNPPNAPV